MSSDLIRAVVEFRRDEVLAAVERRVQAGEDPLQILGELRDGMTEVGERFQAGNYFLAELMLSARIFTMAVKILEPWLAKARPAKSLGAVILATLKGDVHDLGKNIFATLLRAQGFEVYDLGIDVDPVLVLAKVKEVKPKFVGFSALITSAFVSMEQAVKLFEEAGVRKGFKLMVGGGVTNAMLKDHLRADMQTIDVMEGVNYCLNIVKER